MSKKELYEKVLERLKEETLTDTVAFNLTKTEPSIFESKVGGTPYIPKDKELPRDGRDRQLRLLAQIDCENLKTLPDFPHKGLLQFFIADDDIWGLDEENGFAVLYYEDVDRSVTEGECKSKVEPIDPDEIYMPFDGESGIEFTPKKMSMTREDYRYDGFARKMLADEGEENIDNDLFDEVFNNYNNDDDDYGYSNHRIGGYPYFTQYDPRNEDSKETILLFQLDTDYKEDKDIVMWGDCGVGNFFISPEDLKKRDFTNVLYNWDCC